MKKFLLGSIGLVAMAAPAVAADLPARTYEACGSRPLSGDQRFGPA
jgi:hypothetical protein